MVEITYNKKNIIILFITMIIILFFIYKGFIADSEQYIKEYKNYLINISAPQYYFDKINKNKINNKRKNNDEEKIHSILLKVKNDLNNSIKMDEKVITNLSLMKYSKNNKLKNIIKDMVEYLNYQKQNFSDLINLIEKYNVT